MVLEFIEPDSFVLQLTFAVLIFIVALVFGKLLGKIVEKVLSNLGITEVIQKTTKADVRIDKIFGGITSYVIYFLGFVMALNQFGITTTVLNILSGAVLILILLVIFLSVKDIIPNIVAGIMIHSKGLIEEGDVLKIHDIEGVVVQTSIVDTRIQTKKGDIIFIPNARFVKYEVTKKTKLKNKQKIS